MIVMEPFFLGMLGGMFGGFVMSLFVSYMRDRNEMRDMRE